MANEDKNKPVDPKALPLDFDSMQAAFTGYGEPLLGFRWTIEDFPEFFGIKIPRQYCLETSLPTATMGTMTKQMGGTQITLPDVGEVSSFDIQFHEDQKGTTHKYLTAWNEHIQNPYSGGFYLPFTYKRDLWLQLQNNRGEVAIRVMLKGVWPTSLSPLSLNYNGSNVVRWSCGFAVDAVIPE